MTITAMRLNALLTQALSPSQIVTDKLKVAQLPECSNQDTGLLVNQAGKNCNKLQYKSDPCFDNVKLVAEDWGKFDVVEASLLSA
jgi:hypothetical protein